MNSKALSIIKTLSEQGYQAVYAGGCVRDYILGLEPNDIDIATNARPNEIEALFPKTVAVGKAFGVIVVIVDGEEFEVATFRSDGAYSDGRRPDSIEFTSLEEDARRRDLTINGMFYDPLTDKIIDVVGGQTDLEQKIIRLIGNPYDRIKEDKLRLMRVVRFAARLGFEIEENTLQAVQQNSQQILSVSAERIADEMTKILGVKDKKRALELLLGTGLLSEILPEVVAMVGCEQPLEFHKEGDVWVHTLLALGLLPENVSDTLLWGVFLHDIGKPSTQTFEDRIRFSGHDMKGKYMAEEILKRLKFSNEFIDHVVSMVEHHMKFPVAEKMRVSKLKRFMNLHKFDEHLELHRVDCMSSHGGLEHYEFMQRKLKEFEATPETVKLDKLPRLVTGFDLIALGYPKGPSFRTMLDDVQDQQLEEKLFTRDQAIEYIKRTYPL
jgi:poly(A) polymerase